MSAADRTLRYVRGLVIGQGRYTGQPFKVLPWQGRAIRGALKDGVSESAWSLGRGGGKSTLTGAVACAALDGPLAEPGAEVLVVASSHEQGQIVFRHVQRFLADKIAAGEFRMQDTVNTSRLTSRKTGTMLTVKGSDPRRLHGAAPVLTIADELAQWPQRYGDTARLPWGEERVEPGAFAPLGDVILNASHERAAPLARTGGGGLELMDTADALTVRAELPATRAADDVLALVRGGVMRGLSIEFRAVAERMDSGVRVIERARLAAVAVVDTPAYPASEVEARQAEAAPRRRRVWL